jgi:hypothetical protein
VFRRRVGSVDRTPGINTIAGWFPDDLGVIAPAKTKPGDKCAKGVAGCQGGKFNGNFFGS